MAINPYINETGCFLAYSSFVVGNAMTCHCSNSSDAQDRPLIAGAPTSQSSSEEHRHKDLNEALDTARERLEAFARIYHLHWQGLYAVAKQQLQRHRIPGAEYATEDLLQSSMRTVLEQIVEGKIDAVADDNGALENCAPIDRRESDQSKCVHPCT